MFCIPFRENVNCCVLSTEGFTPGCVAKPRTGLMKGSPGWNPGLSSLPNDFSPTGDTENTSPVGRFRHEQLRVDAGGQGLDMVFWASSPG